MSLPLTVSLHDDETALGLPARLARRNGNDARTFCSHFNISFLAVADGKEPAIRKVAELAGIEPKRLLAGGFVRADSGHGAIYRGERFSGPTLRRSPTAFCPSCALEDIE